MGLLDIEENVENGSEPCPECNGTGIVEVSVEEEYCGSDSTVEEECRVCHGTGRI